MDQGLIQFGDSQQTMSSLEIAKATNKRHKDVLYSIRNMEKAWKKVTGRNFRLSDYKDKSGRTLPCYHLSKNETLFVATKFNDEARAKLVVRWEELETGKATPMAQQQQSNIPMPKTGAEMLLMCAQQLVEQERRVNAIESKVGETEQRIAEIEKRTVTQLPYTTIVGYANRFGIRVPLERASVLGRVATNKCKKYGFEMGRVEDPRFGMVKTYPDGVLLEVFTQYYPNVKFQ